MGVKVVTKLAMLELWAPVEDRDVWRNLIMDERVTAQCRELNVPTVRCSEVIELLGPS